MPALRLGENGADFYWPNTITAPFLQNIPNQTMGMMEMEVKYKYMILLPYTPIAVFQERSLSCPCSSLKCTLPLWVSD